MEKVKGIFISLEALASSATLSQKIVFGLLSTFSSPKDGHRLALNHSSMSIAFKCGCTQRTVQNAIKALESRGAIKSVQGGFQVFPWPSCEGEEEQEEAGEALTPGATEAPPTPAPEAEAAPPSPWAGVTNDADLFETAVKIGLSKIDAGKAEFLTFGKVSTSLMSALKEAAHLVLVHKNECDLHKKHSMKDCLEAVFQLGSDECKKTLAQAVAVFNKAKKEGK